MIAITGASDGLGLQLAKLYKEEGKAVVNVSRRESEFSDINISCDLRKGEEIREAARKISEMDEPLEALVNCAGVLSIQPLGEITEEEIDKVMQVNVKAAILLVSELMGKIRKDGTDIVNVSSSVGTKGYIDQAAYGASKWAMRGFSANLREEFKGTPCRVVSFCPGGFRTRLFEKATGTDNTGEGSWMEAKDVALAIKQTLDLPKNMEVLEILVNRK